MKYCFVDCETTGLNPRKHGIWQLAGAIMNSKLEEIERFNLQMMPVGVDIDERALTAGGITMYALENMGSDRECYDRFVKMLDGHVDKFNKFDKLVFAGYNARFDMDFVRAFFERFGNKYFGSYFWFPPIDVMNLAMVCLLDKRSVMPDFKLGTVAAELEAATGEEKFHDASVDIEVTVELYKKCLERMKGDLVTP